MRSERGNASRSPGDFRFEMPEFKGASEEFDHFHARGQARFVHDNVIVGESTCHFGAAFAFGGDALEEFVRGGIAEHGLVLEDDELLRGHGATGS